VKLYPFIKFLSYLITVFIFIRVWYKGGIQSVITLGMIYMLGLSIVGLFKK